MIRLLTIVLLASIGLISVDAKLTFSNCGSASDSIRLTDLQIVPHPILAPGLGSFYLHVNFAQDIANPIKTDFRLTKKFLGINIAVPCTDGVGSCVYLDWCEFCKTCECPLLAGTRVMNMPMNLTASVPAGTYSAEIRFQSATNQKGCVKINDIEMKKK